MIIMQCSTFTSRCTVQCTATVFDQHPLFIASRDQWEGHLPVYNPVFMDGWAPDMREDHRTSLAAANEAQRLRADKIRRAEQEVRTQAENVPETNSKQKYLLEPKCTVVLFIEWARFVNLH